MVMSGVSLPEPIEKKEDQRLVINYSYGFRVVEDLHGPAGITVAENLENNSMLVGVTVGDNNAYLSIYRDRLPRGIVNVVVYGPAIPSLSTVSVEDAGVEQAAKYLYWTSSWNGAENSDRVSAIAWTPYKGSAHNYLVCTSEGAITDVPAVKDQIILDLRTGELYMDKRLGDYTPRWFSGGEIKGGVFSEFDAYEVREVPEDAIDEAAGILDTGVFVVCPESRKMYLVYEHTLIPIDCSEIKCI